MRGTEELINMASRYESVLDVGCGKGNYIVNVRASRRVGIDICVAALDIGRGWAEGQTGLELIQMDLRELHTRFADAHFECVFGADILEHFEKEEGLRLLACCEKIATKCLIWFVPVGLHEQNDDPWGLDNEHYNTHRSVWEPKDMASRGYEVWNYPDWHKAKKGIVTSVAAMYCLKFLDKPAWAAQHAGRIHTQDLWDADGNMRPRDE